MLKFVICDDNIDIVNRLSKLLEKIFIKHDMDASIVLKATEPNEVLEYIETQEINVLILDINLKSAISGCDIADIVRKKNKDVYIIFSTGHLEYALLAYKYKTFDYIPKPIVEERLEETVLRLIEDVEESPARFIKINNRTIVKQNDINYIKKDGMKLVFCASNREYETYNSFSKIEDCLPDNFVRCHKSFIVNVNNVTDFNKTQSTLLFKDNKQCSIGQKYKNKLLEVLKNGNFTNNLDSINNRK